MSRDGEVRSVWLGGRGACSLTVRTSVHKASEDRTVSARPKSMCTEALP